MEFPDAEEHARVILEALEGDYQTALENVYVLRAFGFSEEYCRRIEALLTTRVVRPSSLMEIEKLLRLLAGRVHTTRLKNGARLLDGSDFRAWLVELADDCAKRLRICPNSDAKREGKTMEKETNDVFGEVISSYTSQDAAEDGILVPITPKDAVTRSVWEYLTAKIPMTSEPPANWPVEMMGWFRAGNLSKPEAQKMIAKHGIEAQQKHEQMIRDDKALALAKGLIGSESRTAKRVYENNEGGGIHKIFVVNTATEIVGIVGKELAGITRTLWLIPNELGGVTLMFPEDY